MANEFKFNPMLQLSHVGDKKQQRWSKQTFMMTKRTPTATIHNTCMTILLDKTVVL
jgi:hypothetical protein